jgi:hypothetical protein
MATDVQIANLALRRIGQKSITSLTDSADVVAVKVNDVYGLLRDSLIREHPWRFAVKSAILGHVVDADVTITGATAADPVVITAASHGFSDDDVVSIRDVGGMTEINGKKFTVANKTANTFELKDEDGSDHTAYTSGGIVGKVSVISRAIKFANRYLLPSDYSRILDIKGEPEKEFDYAIQDGGSGSKELLIDDAQINIRYIAAITDASKFDATFVDVFAFRLAAELAFTISQSRTLSADMAEAYQDALAKAKGLQAMERGSSQPIRQDDWLDSRN